MRLFMKYEDCIGCGQCVRACPVNCISLKAEKRPADAPPIWAANGQPIKLHVAVFDIDMSLCCYCNLCTYPCPTFCIYMTPDYEFATCDLTEHLYRFAKKDARVPDRGPEEEGRRRRGRRAPTPRPRRRARPEPTAHERRGGRLLGLRDARPSAPPRSWCSRARSSTAPSRCSSPSSASPGSTCCWAPTSWPRRSCSSTWAASWCCCCSA